MAEYILKRWFEEEFRFRLRDGTEEETVFLGASELLPVVVSKEFGIYEQEFINWRDGYWKPRQNELREELLDYSGNRNRYIDLAEAVKRQQVVPFVGSGMSVSSGLPTWAGFLMQTGEYARCDPLELDQLIRCSSFEEAADLLSRSMNPTLFAERVEHNLRINDPSTINGAVCLLPNLFPDLVLTTNLDNVLEHLYQLCNVPFSHVLSGRKLADYQQLKNPAEGFLIKLHGDYQEQEGRVLLSSEYDDAYAENSRVREEVTLLYGQNSLLFMGCSLGPDRTVSLIHEVAGSGGNRSRHYAFLETPDSDTDRIAREDFLTERAIFPIWYDLAHDEAIVALLDGLYPNGT